MLKLVLTVEDLGKLAESIKAYFSGRYRIMVHVWRDTRGALAVGRGTCFSVTQ